MKHSPQTEEVSRKRFHSSRDIKWKAVVSTSSESNLRRALSEMELQRFFRTF